VIDVGRERKCRFLLDLFILIINQLLVFFEFSAHKYCSFNQIKNYHIIILEEGTKDQFVV
jgi:hypothetical protein